MNRREFLQVCGSAALAGVATRAAEKMSWPIGCFNRAWTKWSYDEALDGIAQAGYKITGFLTPQGGEAFTSSLATPEYLASLKKRIAERGLTANMTTIRFKQEVPLEGNISDLRKQIENAARLELRYMLTFGVDKPEHYENFYRLMADAAAQADKHHIQITMKPHGGGSGASEEILRCIDKVSHPNFKIWYDAGNIIFYTGKDPVAELEPIAKYVTGFCAKDCAAPKAEVMTQLGTGKVDFQKVFAVLKKAGFNGPIMLEGSDPGKSAGEATANARANRLYLEKVIASLS